MIVAVLIVLLLLGLLVASFFVRRHAEAPTPRAGWARTDEAFRDPSSGRLMRVWVDPSDGSRHYVPEGDLPPEP